MNTRCRRFSKVRDSWSNQLVVVNRTRKCSNKCVLIELSLFRVLFKFLFRSLVIMLLNKMTSEVIAINGTHIIRCFRKDFSTQVKTWLLC